MRHTNTPQNSSETLEIMSHSWLLGNSAVESVRQSRHSSLGWHQGRDLAKILVEVASGPLHRFQNDWSKPHLPRGRTPRARAEVKLRPPASDGTTEDSLWDTVAKYSPSAKAARYPVRSGQRSEFVSSSYTKDRRV